MIISVQINYSCWTLGYKSLESCNTKRINRWNSWWSWRVNTSSVSSWKIWWNITNYYLSIRVNLISNTYWPKSRSCWIITCWSSNISLSVTVWNDCKWKCISWCSNYFLNRNIGYSFFSSCSFQICISLLKPSAFGLNFSIHSIQILFSFSNFISCVITYEKLSSKTCLNSA